MKKIINSLLVWLVCAGVAMPQDLVLPLDLVAKRTEATAFVAGVVADVTSDVTQPAPAPDNPDNPQPTPEPGSKCQTCNGTGTVYPDGRIARECQDCGGDGKMSIRDFEQLQARNIGQTIQPDPSIQPNIWTPAQPDKPAYQKINWRTNGTAAKRLTEQTGKPALIYFYAKEGCIGCERYEQTHFKNQDVVQEMNEQYVCLKSDVRKLTPYKLKAWGVTKLPTIIIVDSTWDGRGRQLPFTLDTDNFLAHLREYRGAQQRSIDTLDVTTATYRKGSMRVIKVTGDVPIEQTPIQIGEDDAPSNWQPRSNGSAGGYGGYARSNGSAGGTYQGYARSNGSAGGYGGYYQAAPVAYYESAPVTYYASSGGSSGGAGGMYTSGGSAGGYGGMYSSGGSAGGIGGMARGMWNSMWGGGYSSYPSYSYASYPQYSSYGSGYASSGPTMVCSGGQCYLMY
jgi:hypothetical protein